MRMRWHQSKWQQRITACLIVATLAGLTCGMAEACPSCKAALAGDKGQGDLVRGFFWSILFMLCTPFAVFTGMSGYFYVLVQRARKQKTPTTSQTAGNIAETSRTETRG